MARGFFIFSKNYITIWVLLSSRPSPRHLPGWYWESGWEVWCRSYLSV